MMEWMKELPFYDARRVHFGCAETVYVIDDAELVMSRKRYWENFAVDRIRFKNRIIMMETILKPILDVNHRNNVFAMQENYEKFYYLKYIYSNHKFV